MKKHGKKYRAAAEKMDAGRKYNLEEAVKKLKEIAFAKFDETVELTMWLGVDPRKADQLVRGTLVLPHGLGKSKTVLVIAQGDKIEAIEVLDPTDELFAAQKAQLDKWNAALG